MNFFNKLFSKNPDRKSSEVEREKLRERIRPLLKKAVRLNVGEPQKMPPDSNFKSHFGGMPYLESQLDWPVNKAGTPLTFVFQILNDGFLPMPNEVKLVQFFYDFEAYPWSTDDEGWKLRIVGSVDFKKAVTVTKPETGTVVNYCEIAFEEVKSLPDWDGIHGFGDEISDLCTLINDDEPWEAYEEACEKLGAAHDFKSQVGGYPKWVQSDATPTFPEGRQMPFLLQIDSEEHPGLMWGDSGLVYFFYDPQGNTIDFELQCL